MSVDDQTRRTEELERWLATLDVEVMLPSAVLVRIKHRVGIHIDEQWLSARSPDVPPPGVLTDVKRAVAEEFSKVAPPAPIAYGADAEPIRIYQLFASLSAVAGVLLAFGLGVWSAVSTPDRPAWVVAVPHLVEVMSEPLDENERELESIEEDTAVLEDALAGGFDANWQQTLVDDLTEEIDALTDDLNSAPAHAEPEAT